MANWLMVTSEENFNATKSKGVLGFYGDSRGHILISKTSVGDRVIFYITKKKLAQGVFTVDSAPYVDESPLYGNEKDREWNQRVKVKALDADASTDFTEVRWDMDFIKDKGLPYSAYLVNTLIPLSDKDFTTLLDAMKADAKALRAKA